jgi:hypothetical protein
MNEINFWIDLFNEKIDYQKIPLVLCGNKSDLENLVN